MIVSRSGLMIGLNQMSAHREILAMLLVQVLTGWMPGQMGRVYRGKVWSVLYRQISAHIGRGLEVESIIAGPGDVRIGQNCMIAGQCGVIANNHIFSNPHIPIREQGVTREGIVIEDDCWLGMGVKVLDGVTIGMGSVIGVGTVVTKNVPPFSIAVGVPAKVIDSRQKL
jgi:serine acetyltransferase